MNKALEDALEAAKEKLEDGQELDVSDLKAEAPKAPQQAAPAQRGAQFRFPGPAGGAAGFMAANRARPEPPNPINDPNYFVNTYGARPAGKAARVRYDRMLVDHTQRSVLNS